MKFGPATCGIALLILPALLMSQSAVAAERNALGMYKLSSPMIRWSSNVSQMILPRAQEANDNGYVYWNFENASDITDVEQTMDPTQLAPSTFWAQQEYLASSSGAYMGIQTDISGGPSTAIFSLWNATTAVPGSLGSACQPFGGEGIGLSCSLPYAFESDNMYRFDFDNVGGTSWQASIDDLTTGATSIIGVITAPDGETSVTSVANFSEFFGETITCNSSPESSVKWSAPTASTEGVSNFNDLSSYAGAHFGGDACSNFGTSLTNKNGVQVVSASLGGINTVASPASSPGPPTSVGATAGDRQATLTWSPPLDTGGANLTSYTATSIPGSFSCTTTTTSCTVTGLSDGTTYIFSVTASNSVGPSAQASQSNAVTPLMKLTIESSSLREAVVAQSYRLRLQARGGSGTDVWRVTGGSLPAGLHLTSAGLIVGRSIRVQTTRFTVLVSDQIGMSFSRSLTIRVVG